MALTLGNAYWLVEILFSVPTQHFQTIAMLALDLTLLSFLMARLIGSLSDDQPLRTLERLERDLVFGELDGSQIKQRFEEEVIGREVSSVLRHKLTIVRECAEDLSKFLSTTDEFLLQQKAIDPSMKYERQGRLQEFLNVVDEKSDHYKKNFKVLKDWLEHAATQRSFYDDYLLSLLKETTSNLNEINSSILARIDETKKMLKGMQGSIGAQLKGLN